jgi:protein-tyrosine phosphatase
MLKAITSHIHNKFGSRRGLLSSIHYELIGKAGGFSLYRRVDWSRVERLVFICAGNICRSPLAEAVARDCGVPAVSAGITCDGGHPADERVIACGAQWGLDLRQHRSLPIQRLELTATDLVVGMEPGHLNSPVLASAGPVQLTLLGLWGSPRKVYIHDPYGTGPGFFERCAAYVAESTRRLVRVWGEARGKRPSA